MKLHWNKLCENLASYGDLISKTLEFLPQTKQSGKIKKHLAKEWEKITKSVEELDVMIDPINPIEIKYPFESERFKAMWKYYKDYLTESHNMTLPSRVENSRLTQLYRFSRKDEERAMQMLELFCANNYRNIICPSEKQLSGEEPVLPEQKMTSLSINQIHQEI
ncbi:MAG: hypothetical protein LBJ72_08535 [Dysgonamonadaceae bacterium]|jgi:hypothetical protein|nr:hypothetical protein [Dysgonamonadaceae bacterium]